MVHRFECGFAGALWLRAGAGAGVRLVMRWPAGYNLRDLLGE
ncbi:MAG TPA: hypothetical protein VEZ12_18820 [Herpetosiphonaceae bacterium]|nr:hypothetical protein [Herpetosiphonaceae bacterium]